MLPALGLFVALILRFVEDLRVRDAALIALACVAGSWLLFEKLLSVPLPKPALW